MMEWLGDLLKRYGRWLLLLVFLLGIIVWGIAHSMAQSGEKVSVLWGMVEYTKGKQPATVQSAESKDRIESVASPPQEPTVRQLNQPNNERKTEDRGIPGLAGVSPPRRATILHQGKAEVMVVDLKGKPQRLAEAYVSGNEKWVNKCLPGPTSKVFDILSDAKVLSVNATVCPPDSRWVLDQWRANRGEPLIQEQYRIVVNGVSIEPTNEIETTENSANFVLNLRRK